MVSFIGAILLLAVSGSQAQEQFDRVFSQAKSYYDAARYDSTIALLQHYLTRHGKDPSTEYIVPLLMEAQVRTGDYNSFKRVLGIYRRKFPESAFTPRLFYLDGIVRSKEQDFRRAIYSFSDAVRAGLSPELTAIAHENVETLCENDMSVSEISRLAGRTDLEPGIAEIIAFYEVKKLYDDGQATRAKRQADEFRRKYPRSSYHADAREIRSKSRTQQRGTVSVGVLAPITGDNADIGKYVVQGVKLAVEDYNRHNTTKIDLIILDTRGNMVETAKKTLELVNEHRTNLIIGPVLSANATVAASVLAGYPAVVMVTPTATDDGIASLGKNIFQMNVTLGILGRRIARYALQNLNIKEFAVFAPLSEYGEVLTANFREEVGRLGGEVLDVQRFEMGTNDFRIQFDALRKNLAGRRWEQLALEGQAEYGKEAKGTRAARAKELYLADSTIEIGGFFIPAESDDVTKIAAQVFFHRIRTQMLGSNGWHTAATITNGKRYVENAIISTNFEADTKNQQWLSFSRLYWDRFGENPDHVAAPLGYDAANLILNALGQRGDVGGALRLVKDYHGVSGTISFDTDEGANSEAAILKIHNKSFFRVQ